MNEYEKISNIVDKSLSLFGNSCDIEFSSSDELFWMSSAPNESTQKIHTEINPKESFCLEFKILGDICVKPYLILPFVSNSYTLSKLMKIIPKNTQNFNDLGEKFSKEKIGKMYSFTCHRLDLEQRRKKLYYIDLPDKLGELVYEKNLELKLNEEYSQVVKISKRKEEDHYSVDFLEKTRLDQEIISMIKNAKNLPKKSLAMLVPGRQGIYVHDYFDTKDRSFFAKEIIDAKHFEIIMDKCKKIIEIEHYL